MRSLVFFKFIYKPVFKTPLYGLPRRNFTTAFSSEKTVTIPGSERISKVLV